MPVKRIEVPVEALDYHLRRHSHKIQPRSNVDFGAGQALIVALERLPVDAVLIRVVPVERRAGYVVIEYDHASFPRDYYMVGAEQNTPAIPDDWDYAREKPSSAESPTMARASNSDSTRRATRGTYDLPGDGGNEGADSTSTER